MAISPITNAERSRAWAPPGVPVRPPSFRVSFTLVRRAAKAGASPQTRPVSTARMIAKATTCQSRPISSNARQRLGQASSRPRARRLRPEPGRAGLRYAQHQALQNRLPQQRSGGRSQRQTHCNFAAAADGADQQQSGKIGAGDQQHDDDCQEQVRTS